MKYDLFFQLAKEAGIEEAELFIENTKAISFSLFHSKIDNYKISDSTSIIARGLVNGKFGAVTCDSWSKNKVKYIVEEIVKNAKAIENDDPQFIFDGSEKYHKFNRFNKELAKVSIDEKINKAKELEAAIKNFSPMIVEVPEVEYEEQEETITLINSKGPVATFGILYLLKIENWIGLSFSVVTGLAAGVIIGQATEYYTSHSYKPTQKISEAGLTGSATVIIKGIGTGMISTCIPVITIGVAIMLSYLCANGFDGSMSSEALSHGLYGIGIAAVGMLSTLGITLATDAYGPIADNAGGNAEMSELGEEVRHRTDALDALGNTTAATGKGFAIGSAALTALALLASYIEEVKIAMERAGMTLTNLRGDIINASQATIPDFMNHFQVNLMNPRVLVGAFIGAMAAFLFCGLTMEAVGRAAQKMVEEVRRQFREIAGILEGKATPDYGRCVEISTRAAQHEMIFPSLLAIAIPIVVGCVLGVAGVLGLLVGGLACGFTLAVFMANAGGAWDNAKKMVEEGNFGGKGSFAHKATIVGDTVGDPFKDTSGPSLNILIKLMSMVSIVMAGLTVLFS